MSDFLGLFHSSQADALRGRVDAPYRILGSHAFCGPDAADDGAAAAILTGRLRNAARLIERLRDGGAALPPSPTLSQIFLAAWRLWGEDCFRHLEGPAWGAALDAEQDALILLRDPMGEGRVFYAKSGDGIAFASRAESLLAAPGVRPVIDGDGLRELFALGPARTPGRTPFAQIQELEAGCALVARGGDARICRYFQLEARPFEDSPQRAVEKVRGLLEDAVAAVRPLQPLCMLSGGLDSTLLTALASPKGAARSFSVDYAGNDQYFQGGTSFQGSEDAPFVRQASQYLGTEHRAVTLEQADLAHALIDARRARFFPGMADVDSSLLLFARALSPWGKYALSGECGDEVFGGYPWFHRESLIQAEGFPWSGSLELRASILRPALREKLNLGKYARETYRQALSRLPRLPGEEPRAARLRALQGLCFQYFMPNLQERALRMCQAAGVAVLTPYCDSRLAQYVYNAPWELKDMGGMEKGLLRAAAEGVLPDGLRLRKKSPYPKTYHPQFGRLVAEMCIDALRKPDSPLSPLLDMDAVEALSASALSPKDTPWFGQLMTLPQMLGYLIQLDNFLRETKAEIEL